MQRKILNSLIISILFGINSYLCAKEYTPSYYVSKISIDSTLKPDEAVFVINFSTNDNGIIKNEVKLAFNGKNLTQKPDSKGNISIKTKPGKYIFQFYYNSDYKEIKTGTIIIKSKYKTEIKVNFESSKFPVIADKPVIYVYPTKTSSVNIKLNFNGTLGFTYPKYDKAWQFVAYPDGGIHINDKKFHYLFYDGKMDINTQNIKLNEGFIVSKANLVTFFEEKLSKMGLNSKEINDYITYWVPQMTANENNYIHFMFDKEYSQYSNLEITPKPDTIFRVFMVWYKLGGTISIKLNEQKIESFTRKGFTVVEWGGAEISHHSEQKLSKN
ncbi:MAG: hypothetical protein SFY56_00460 [Bacteroidota bacterium]|nr:hypothetical protein [Bacteroidota bacterium]